MDSIKKDNKNQEEQKFDFVFAKTNYILMIVGLVVLGLGYILLCGGGSDNPDTFNPAMFNNQRLVVAPILIVVGFVVEIIAIMFNTKKKKEN